MADLNQALFRIDPTEGLLQYVQAVKPFHSKVLDVFVEYIYSEALNANITDSKHIEVGLQNFIQPVLHTCGFGFAWNPYNAAFPVTASIISAQGPIELLASVVPGTTITTVPDVSGFTFTVNQPVTFRTTGTFPTQLSQGGTYYVKTVGVNQITISDTVGGTVKTFSGSYTGQLSVIPQDLKYNSFLVSMPVATPFPTVVSGLVTNQMTLATPFTVVSVNPTLKRWVVNGDFIPVIGDPLLVPGDDIYISGNTDPSSNGKYTVVSVVAVTPHVQYTITVSEPISLVAANNGRLNVPFLGDAVPYWPAGLAVKIASTAGFPYPIVGSTIYYFNPTPQIGVFNLSKVRYPQKFDDIVDLSTLGDGQLTIFRVEPFVPGELVTVTGSYLGENDGQYAINTIQPEGLNFRLTVWQHVPQATPVGAGSDGSMTYSGGYGDPYCAVAASPALYTAGFFHERIRFDFGPSPVSAYLLDTFSGIGDLSTHTVDSGHIWSILQYGDSLAELILSGSGTLSTTDTDIWVRSNWTPPVSTTFSVEVDLFVNAAPLTGQPRFTLLAKEANIGTFNGPFVDIQPDLATGKIKVILGSTSGGITTASLYTTTTSINTGSGIIVKLERLNNNQARLYINGTLMFTSGVITWPTLTYVGFNINTPAGDPTQFALSRIQAVPN